MLFLDWLTATTSSATESGLWDDHDNAAQVDESTQTTSSSSEESVETQLDKYLKAPRLPRSTDIYGYWHCSEFPLLEPAARKYLSAPLTSVASEQLFSAAGQIYAEQHSNLLGENAEKLLFWANNIRLVTI